MGCGMYLEKIQKENDIKKLKKEQLPVLAQEIRDFLIEKISVTGGHLASNLGVVELTMALHLHYNLPEDKIIWDVGHQAYTHKLLTGRQAGFNELRKYGGLSGFPKRKESDCDAFDTGHSSTSISAGVGYASARDLQNEDYRVISVIGDGSLTGGMAYEALNNAATLNKNFVIILNDNTMSISKNVGGMSQYLDGLRTAKVYNGLKDAVENAVDHLPVGRDVLMRHLKKTKNSIKQLFVPGMFFEDMGITYLGPINGHDFKALSRALKEADKVEGAVIVHVLTEKGKGFEPAEKNPAKYHGTGPFDMETGKALDAGGKESYTSVFSKVMVDMAQKDDKLVAITAAMEDGTGLAEFHKRFPERFFDVGIAEGHGVTFAAGLAAGGLRPVFAVYSSFLQRGYDQMIHDVCIQNLPVVFAVDRAGLVGSDGETHQGVFDLSYMSMIPNMTILSPKNKYELADMLRFAVRLGTPVAVRYPRGSAYDGHQEYREPIKFGKSESIYEESDIAIISVGHMFESAVKTRKMLKEKGYNCSLINARFIKPIDEAMIEEVAKNHRLIVTIEENVANGGFGESVLSCVSRKALDTEVYRISLPDDYIEHGNVDALREEVMMNPEAMAKRIIAAYIAEESRRGTR